MADAARRKKDRERKSAVLASILLYGRGMNAKAREAIARNRQAARVAAAKRLRAELAQAGIAVAAATLLNTRGRAAEDAGHAESSAASLAAAWQGIAIVKASAALRKGEDTARAIEATRAAMGYRIDRTAATETALAYSDEHRAALEAAAQHDAELAERIEALGLVRVWSSILDRRTCPECEARDGTIIEDAEPPLHPMCRCVSVLMTRSEALALAA